MPFHVQAMVRRRTMLGITQQDLAITAGVSPSTIQKIEQHKIPNDGGNIGIDVLMRIALALRMEYRDLMIAPTGNRYTRAVQFAAHQHSPGAAPKLHDRSRSVRADGYRALTKLHAAGDVYEDVINRREEDAPAQADAGDALRSTPNVEQLSSFERDPSTE